MSTPSSVASGEYRDLLAAVVDFVGRLFDAADPDWQTPAIAGVWSDWKPAGRAYPYAVVIQLPEQSSAQTEDFATAGVSLSNLATGRMQVAFYAESKEDANAMGDKASRYLTDTYLWPTFPDSRLVGLVQDRTESAVLGDTGPGTPTVFCRIVQVLYVIQSPE